MAKIMQNKINKQYHINLPKRVIEALGWHKGTEMDYNIGHEITGNTLILKRKLI